MSDNSTTPLPQGNPSLNPSNQLIQPFESEIRCGVWCRESDARSLAYCLELTQLLLG